MEEKQGLPIRAVTSAQEWESWLADQHGAARGVWLKLAKKRTGIDTVSYAEAVEAALCYGWIDGQGAAYDDTYWLQKFTPRGARSVWSKLNRVKAMELIAQGRMAPAGIAAVEAAQRDGRWERAYDPPSTASVPEDFQRALDANPTAAEFFATLNRTNRYAMLYRIQDAKKPETRARRIDKFVQMLLRREKLYP
ncbi:MAG: YdeI/OmpD-associated family protein [Actinomycetota bacterium]|nr:YdeI/OmpD-associated family protein [Actinomycetota bacterium]